MLKATKVDGVYDKDPEKHDDAELLPRISSDRVLADRLAVMDSTAISLCMDNKLPIVVFNLTTPGNVLRAVMGEPVGSVVTA